MDVALAAATTPSAAVRTPGVAEATVVMIAVSVVFYHLVVSVLRPDKGHRYLKVSSYR